MDKPPPIQFIQPIEPQSRLIRMGIQGPPGSGKTASALTFPNPVFANFDRGDIAGLIKTLPHLKDIKVRQVPFWNAEFIAACEKQWGFTPLKSRQVNRTEVFKKWLREEATKLAFDNTLVIDSWTSFQDSMDEVLFHELEQSYTNKGEIDHFAPWDLKIIHSENVCNLLARLNCNVVVLFHESQVRDTKTGVLLDKIAPLMQGKFVAKLKNYFPLFVRQLVKQKTTSDGKPEGNPMFMWQIKSTQDFDCKFVGLPDRPTFVEAQYKNIIEPT